MSAEDLYAHLAEGSGNVCQCWRITRSDGVVFGFTDHDQGLRFGGVDYMADSGMSASALASSTGLSVDNSDAVGLLQADVITDVDISAGRYDGAEVRNWLVRWDDVTARALRFYGTIGQITRDGGQFQAELRGLSEALNQPQGRSFLRTCSAVLGDGACGFDTSDVAFSALAEVDAIDENRTVTITAQGFADRWFEQGKLVVKDGTAKGLSATIKHDRKGAGQRVITLWSPLRADLAVGDEVQIIAGCDKRAATCQTKFDNFENFQGFPHIPGEDWMLSVPRAADADDSESMN